MNTQNLHTASFNYFEITLPTSVVYACSHSGKCDDDIKASMALPEVMNELNKIDKNKLVKELSEYGAWDMDELNDHQCNLERILWIAAGNIQEEWHEQETAN